ncbi:anhydro-N-acetylmuramic acid kinase [Enterococcus sp. PF1-24]|uniref:anhydro-N-acetylmuramic acid kinase AnmK n=1 Tax=unclassified Enterococcus TaxID=2608891 RepID=UPI002473C4A3|nr:MULTISPECIES: anhydro-N-acetylmuramic acid kinase AnmK [unclassified Enterococcus]MDH6364374.1 anhydro-N-acetylmuramic acid kinase [Enterococcus sp. PFB1-1]MDH6401437.1 anhydro-N-acetylmuramic acid kinase [Enterococcus sp. PF1-24]
MVYAVGLMSGTSLDGIDAALVEISGENQQTSVKLLEFLTMPLPADTLKRIRAALSIEESNVEKICSLNFELGEKFAEAAIAVCQKAAIAPEELAFIGSHGQTLFHIPEARAAYYASTLQIGDPAIISERTKTTVVSNFRERDMAVSGQGAPIVPYSEYVLFKSETCTRLLQNIGGIGNVTVLPKNGQLEDTVAFDTGPGNVIINELCLHFYQKEYDKDGLYAQQGTVNEKLLTTLMNHPYIKQTYPKTTGRETFGKQFTHGLLAKWQLSAADWLATATMFTARSIAQAVTPFIDEQTELIVGGGGSYNHTLMTMLQSELPTIQVKTQEDLGESSEAKEAIAMAILANQTLHHQPSNVPSATGAYKSVPLGRITFYQ